MNFRELILKMVRPPGCQGAASMRQLGAKFRTGAEEAGLSKLEFSPEAVFPSPFYHVYTIRFHARQRSLR